MKSRFSRIIVLRNPASTHAHKVHKRIELLRGLAPNADFLTIDTHEGGKSVNQSLIADLAGLLGSETLLCIAAGDGTSNLVIESLLTNPALEPAARQTVIFPLWGGNANDLACMLNGSPWGSRVLEIATEAPAIPIRPLRCELTFPDGTSRTHLAACYASFGASAFAAKRLAEPHMRSHPLDRVPGGRVVKELAAVVRALIDSPMVFITQNEHKLPMYEHIFLNGSRFAKVKGTPLKLTDPYFYHTIIPHKGIRSLALYLRNLTSKETPSHIRSRHVSFRVDDAVWAQFDGEVFMLPAGTNIDITPNHEPFYALSTLLG
jgi:diacylglycerol kinase family enzyme